MSGHITALQGVASGGGAAPAKNEPYGLNDLMNLSVSTGAISPAMARTMRDTMHFERQRTINDRNVRRLAEEMRRGWFLSGTPIFICVLPDKRQVVVNGNHTLEAVDASGVTVPLVMIRRHVKDLEEAARVYATFDLQKARTWKDTLQATGFSEDVPHADKVIAAIGIIMQGFRTTSGSDPFNSQSRIARLEMLPDFMEPAHIIASAILGGETKAHRMALRAAFLAVALYTAKYQPAAAHEFWRGFAMDDGLRANDPRKVLLRYGTNHRSAGSQDRTLHSIAAALAWNAFFEGRTLEYVKPGQTTGIRILGTPLHKGVA